MQTQPIPPADIHVPSFTPVALARTRSDGWTPRRQRQYVLALCMLGSSADALRAVQISRASLHNLKRRPDAASFNQACRDATFQGQQRVFGLIMDRVTHGHVKITASTNAQRIDFAYGPDLDLMRGALRTPPSTSPPQS
jgi:hypothetical protein